MNVWIIAAVYQGVFTGIELVTVSEVRALDEYEKRVRETVDMPDQNWEQVEAEYDLALGMGAKVDEIYLEAALVED